MVGLKAGSAARAMAGGADASAIALTSAGRGIAGLMVIGAVVLATMIPALAKELFWLIALTRPSRDLGRLLRQTNCVHDTERLARTLYRAQNAVVNARSNEDRRAAASR
jgi:hypothetical protein